MTPSPFEVGRSIGGASLGALKQRQENNQIEQIIAQATESGDPEMIQNTIGTILSKVAPERQGAAINYLSQVYNSQKEKKNLERTRAAEIEAGVTPGLHPSLQTQQLKNKNSFETKRQNRLDLETTSKHYERVINNLQKEYDSLSNTDPDYMENKKRIKQELSNLRNEQKKISEYLTKNNKNENTQDEPEATSKEPVEEKPNFDASNPEHKKRATELYKKHKDVEMVRKILMNEFTGLEKIKSSPANPSFVTTDGY